MKMTLQEIIDKSKELGSYFITITTKDGSKEENDLEHHVFREKFELEDVIPALDNSVRSLGVRPFHTTPTVKPPGVWKEAKPLKIAIFTHFNRCPDSYSPGKAVKNQIKILQSYGHAVSFFVQEGSTLDVGCTMMPIVPKFKREKNVVNDEAKAKIIDVLREEITGKYDVVITHDLYIDDCITFREAIKECGIDVPWLHWARSGVGREIDFKMPNAKYVYMNDTDTALFAQRIGVDHDDIRVVYNEKDPSLLFNWSPITKKVSDKLRLWEKDIIQAYPMCTTRMDAKGINGVIRTFAQLKKSGKNVALIICNSNGRKRIDEIQSKMAFALEQGLTEDDFLFTSTLEEVQGISVVSEVPHRVVAELMQVSNLFVFPTIAEVCSNVLLEASMTKNLLVLNEDLPSLFDFVDKTAVLKYPFTSSRSMHYSGRTDVEFETLAKQIIGQLDSNKADKQFRHVWKTHSIDSLYNNMLKPVLYEHTS